MLQLHLMDISVGDVVVFTEGMAGMRVEGKGDGLIGYVYEKNDGVM
jgi:hypothetical protein